MPFKVGKMEVFIADSYVKLETFQVFSQVDCIAKSS